MITDRQIIQEKILFDFAYLSEIGARKTNEDALAIENNENCILLSMADGLGAHGGGDIAANIAADIAKEQFTKMKRPTARQFYELFQDINEAIVQKQTEEIQMKTTFACAILKNKHMYSAHLGDTRIYVFENGKRIHLTADHSLAYANVMKEKGTLDDIRNSPDRNILTAALGVWEMRRPAFWRRKINAGTAVLICSDGFWEYVNEYEMENSLNSSESSREWLERMMKCYFEKADEINDNYSAICLKIKKNGGVT